MKKMKVALIGLGFDPTEHTNNVSINLPDGTKILSVEAPETKPIMWITFMYPSEAYSSMYPSEAYSSYPLEVGSRTCHEFQFIIGECDHVEIELDEHEYLNNINIGEKTYAVFYQKRATKKT